MPVELVAEDQNIDKVSGQLVDVYVITYTLPNHPGTFTVSVPKTAEALVEAEQAIADLTTTINGLYGIP